MKFERQLETVQNDINQAYWDTYGIGQLLPVEMKHLQEYGAYNVILGKDTLISPIRFSVQQDFMLDQRTPNRLSNLRLLFYLVFLNQQIFRFGALLKAKLTGYRLPVTYSDTQKRYQYRSRPVI